MEIKSANTTNLLAISAHQDDIEIMAMDGILRAYGSKKYAFYAAVVGDGANCLKAGKYSEVSDKEMIEARNQEQLRASQIGEYSKLYFLKHAHSEIEQEENESIIKELQKLILEVKPEIVYTHNIFDKNPHHVKITQLVIDAINGLNIDDRPRLLYGCEIFRSLDWLPDKYKITFDLSDNKELQQRLVNVYDTRVEQSRNYTKAVMGRKLANAAFVSSNCATDEDKMYWYGINLTPVIQKNISLNEYCIKILNDFNRELLTNIK